MNIQVENRIENKKVFSKVVGHKFKCTIYGKLGHDLDKYMRKNSICVVRNDI